VRIAFKTLGCRLNQAETDGFAAEFAAAGWQVVPFGAPADAVIVHSCAVTRTAERDGLRVARGIKRQTHASPHAEPFVALVGCAVDADPPQLVVAGVDLLVPRAAQARLVDLVTAGVSRTRPEPSPASADAGHAPRRKRALLKIQDGCDFGCAYCIVPHTRGGPVSRPFDACLVEGAALLAAGYREIVLAGCNVGCYRDGRRHLPELVAALAQLDGIGRIRLSSIEPSTVEREIVDLMASCPKLCRHLHLPLQSGDADVLRAMGRHYTPGDYEAILSYAQTRIPDLGLGCDIITGFPGETPAAFEHTRRLVADWPFSNLHVFPYSERPGTPAADLPGAVPRAERKARARALIDLLAPKRQAFAATFVGRPVEVVIEHVTPGGHGHGWSGPYLACRVAGVARELIGQIIAFTPIAAVDGVLDGRAGGETDAASTRGLSNSSDSGWGAAPERAAATL
jgi:threonylcarbamoyladenosine tRNA methylthiotransferase MtaB